MAGDERRKYKRLPNHTGKQARTLSSQAARKSEEAVRKGNRT